MNKNIIGNRYIIIEEIGRGGMSVVYLAWDKHLEKNWAVKKINKDQCFCRDPDFLYKELMILKKLKHESLPYVADVIDCEYYVFIVMEFIEGITLKEHLKKYGREKETDVIRWGKQLCKLLIYLHSQSPPIIYRDLKPSNVILRSDGKISIVDFGISRELVNDEEGDTEALGTGGYAPPEQYNSNTDQRSDIYAWGMTMHHLLTGVDPGKSRSYMPIRAYDPNISEEIEKIIEKCTQTDADKRYRSAKELLADVEDLNKKRRRLNNSKKEKTAIFLTGLLIMISIIFFNTKSYLSAQTSQETEYEQLLEMPSAETAGKRAAGCITAAELYPERIDAYLRLLEIYEEGEFTENESAEFLKLYGEASKEQVLSPEDFVRLNYKAGLMYFNFYTRSDGSVSFSERIQKSYSFFRTAAETEDVETDEKELAEYYYKICRFYKEYVFASVQVNEAETMDYEELLGELSEMAAMAESSDVINEHGFLTILNSIFMIIFDIRYELADVCTDVGRVLEFFDEIYHKASGLNVNNENSKKLKEEITDNYENYRKMIEDICRIME